jgi:hypothetical protein
MVGFRSAKARSAIFRGAKVDTAEAKVDTSEGISPRKLPGDPLVDRRAYDAGFFQGLTTSAVSAPYFRK